MFPLPTNIRLLHTIQFPYDFSASFFSCPPVVPPAQDVRLPASLAEAVQYLPLLNLGSFTHFFMSFPPWSKDSTHDASSHESAGCKVCIACTERMFRYFFVSLYLSWV